MEETLDEALERLFPRGGSAGHRRSTGRGARARRARRRQPAPRPDVAALAAQAREHYQRAMQAQREGNWALYGEEIKRLGEVLARAVETLVVRPTEPDAYICASS